MTKIIGLTGGIGSGKTTVAKMFEDVGIPVFIADEEGKNVTKRTEVKDKIVEVFGKDILTENEIDRKKLAAIVFNESSKLALLNDIIHPAVKKSFEIWCKLNTKEKIVIYESAILFETVNRSKFFKTITVSAPENLRIARVKKRNGLSEEEIKVRIINQWTDSHREEQADYVISNINIEDTRAQVLAIVKEL